MGATVDSFELRIAGNTATKLRPKFNSFTKRAINPPSNIVSENDIRAHWREAGEPRLPDDVALTIEMLIVVSRPDSHYKKNGVLSKEGLRHPVPRTRKPDVDNALKAALDALNTRAYKDDVRFARAVVDRTWGEWPETRIVIKVHEDEEPDE